MEIEFEGKKYIAQPKDEVSQRMSRAGKARWKDKTKEQRSQESKKFYSANRFYKQKHGLLDPVDVEI